MPVYEYQREDGTIFEVRQSIKDDALEICPTTGQKIKRIMSLTGRPKFNGRGFYETDYVKQKK